MLKVIFALVIISTISACSVTRESRPKYHNPNYYATQPGNVKLSQEKLSFFKKELPYLKARRLPDGLLDEHLRLGDSRAAIVMKTQPYVLIAAYSREIDAIAMLRFDKKLATLYGLKEGAHLLTVNTYSLKSTKPVSKDLILGPNEYGQYGSVYPLIAEFLSDEMTRISQRKNEISNDEWQRARMLGRQYIQRYGFRARNGNPYTSMIPAEE